MIDKIFNIVAKGSKKSDDDFADRINYRYTAGILAMGAFLITWYTAFGDVIQCWTPTYFAGAWIDYANNLCFIKNTYYLPMDISIEKGRKESLTYSITYYQWIPLFFMLLSMCFYIPRAVWYNVFSHHFVDINAIVDLLTSFDNAVNPETRDPAVQQVANHIHRYLCNSTEYRNSAFFEARKSVSKKCKTFAFYIGRRYGLQVTLIYLIIKMLYIVVGINQLYWIDSFLRGSEAQNWTMTTYYTNIFSVSYVWTVMSSLFNGTNWENSPSFPRVTMCDFETRALGQNQKFSIQCVLPINLFNEKIFLFLYCWILGVVIITSSNLGLWIYRLAFSCSRKKYIMKHLTLMGRIEEGNRIFSIRVTKRLINVFIHDYLRPDGVFLLRLIAINTNCLIASEIIANLWDAFKNDPKIKKKAQTYNLKYRQKYGSESSAERLEVGSAIGNDDDYSSQSQQRITIKRRNQKSFSIFQPSLDESQTTPKELLDLRKLQSTYSRTSGMSQKVGFHEPGPDVYSREPRAKKKKNFFYTCIDCDDVENESEYDAVIGMIEPPAARAKRPSRSRKNSSTKTDGLGKKIKNFLIYNSSGSESDISDEGRSNPETVSGNRLRAPKKVSSFLGTCLSIDEDGGDDSGGQRKPVSSLKSEPTLNSNPEHRQDTIPTHQRHQQPLGMGVPPPTYTQAAGIPAAPTNGRR